LCLACLACPEELALPALPFALEGTPALLGPLLQAELLFKHLELMLGAQKDVLYSKNELCQASNCIRRSPKIR
jgi:hypothetical protein